MRYKIITIKKNAIERLVGTNCHSIMWGPWAIGMATASTINRFEHVGLHMFDPKAGLTVLEAALGIKRAELVVASFN